MSSNPPYHRHINRTKAKETKMSEINENNNELRVISVEELKQFKGLSKLSNKEAKRMIAFLKKFSLILYKTASTHGKFGSVSQLCQAEQEKNSK